MIVPIYFDLDKSVAQLFNLEAILKAAGYVFYADAERATLVSIAAYHSVLKPDEPIKVPTTLEEIECILEDK